MITRETEEGSQTDQEIEHVNGKRGISCALSEQEKELYRFSSRITPEVLTRVAVAVAETETADGNDASIGAKVDVKV